MTPLDTLKAGIKTAMVTLLVGVIGVVTTFLPSIMEWASSGAVPDFDTPRTLLFVLVAACVVGLVNTLLRYAQVVGPIFIDRFIGLFLGRVPSYPETEMVKTITPDTVTKTP